MKNKTIGIMGNGFVGKSIHHLKEREEIFIETKQSSNQLPFPKPPFGSDEPYVLENPYPPVIEEKQFICKGRHQYHEVITNNKSEWICQCGKKL